MFNVIWNVEITTLNLIKRKRKKKFPIQPQCE